LKPIDRVKSNANLRDVNWLYLKDMDWDNERVIVGPLTTPDVDLQKERVFLGRDRLEFIFKHGKLIYEHHANPAEPVVILGDCLGIGTDKIGKTFAIWGVASGSETIDEAWEEMKKYGEGGGFSIGGKRRQIDCENGICTLTNPEVTEVSWTPRPANPECTVYYISQFAKHIIEESQVDTFEIKTQLKKMNKHLGERFKVDPTFDVSAIQKSYPCTKEYVMGMMEKGLKRDEAELMLSDYLTKISKEVTEMEQEPDKVEKMDLEPAQSPAQSGGNAVLELLGNLENLMTQMCTKLDALTGSNPVGQEPEPDMEKAPKPPEDEDEQPTPDEDGGDATGDDEKEPEGDDAEKKKKELEKSDASMNLPEGENPEPEGPNPEDTDEDVPSTDKIDLSEGEDPEPEGKETEVEAETDPVDHGDVDQESKPLGLGEGKNPEEEGPNPEISKGLIKKPGKTDVDNFLKQNRYVMVKHDARTVQTVDDPHADAANQPEKYEKQGKKPSILDQLKNGSLTVQKS